MKLLDLFCGAGGAGEGYRRAGFDVTGVDIKPQKNNPHRFIQGDALKYLRDHGHEYDAIHASPPCQGYTWSAKRWTAVQRAYLIEPTRAALIASGKPYVIENVPGAPLLNHFRLCGVMFGLNVIRHRHFEASFAVEVPAHIPHRKPITRQAMDGTGRTVQRSSYCTVAGHGGESGSYRLSDWREAMGIDWMTRVEIVEAIPPSYTEYIGRELMRYLQRDTATAAAQQHVPHNNAPTTTPANKPTEGV